MTIEEMKKERETLENVIEKAVEVFEKTTGVYATSVRTTVLYGTDGHRGWKTDVEVHL